MNSTIAPADLEFTGIRIVAYVDVGLRDVQIVIPVMQHDDSERTYCNDDNSYKTTHLTLPTIGPTSSSSSEPSIFFCLNFGGPPSLSMVPNTSGSGQSPSYTNLAVFDLQLAFHCMPTKLPC